MAARTAPEPHWVELCLEVPALEAERAADLLYPFAPAGAAITLPHEPASLDESAAVRSTGTARVCCYVQGAEAPALRRRVRAALAATGWSAPAPRLRTRRLRQERWHTAWRRGHPLLHIGRVVVRPPFRRYRAKPGEVVVTLEPGLAFGTGQHATTRMALQALDHWLRPGQTVLDFGTGSGILACAAARLGAARVAAIDRDPDAVAAARRNVALNGLERVVRVREGRRPGRGRYDVLVANITAAVLTEQAPRLAAAVRPGGQCILGGIIEAELRRVRRAVRASGLRPQETIADGEWRTVRAICPADLR